MIGTRPAPRRRSLLVRLCLVALCLAVALATVSPAFAADSGKPAHHHGRVARIDILSPRPEARVGDTVDVRVRVSTFAGFSASLAGHDVTKRFHRHGGLLEARLRRGRDFDLGENYLMVATGRGRSTNGASVRFLSRVRAKRLLTVTRLDRSDDRTPLRFRIAAGASLAHLKVTVDRHRYPMGMLDGQRSWTIEVGANDGLRYGHNVLRVAAEPIDGKRFDRERVDFKVSRTGPLVGAGPDRITRPGRAVALDGSVTQAGPHAGPLLYRWQIVRKPAGSHAGVVGGTGRRARLKPDLPGTYRLRLVAAQASEKLVARDRARTATATASSAASTEPTCLPNLPSDLIPAGGGPKEGSAGASVSNPNYSTGPSVPLSPYEPPVCVRPTGEASPPPLPLAKVGAMAADEMEVLVQPTLSPMGRVIETIASDGSTRIGPQVYSKASGFAHLLILNYETLELEKEEFFSLADAPAMANAVKGTSPRQIVVLTGMAQAQGQAPAAAEEALVTSIKTLGGFAPPSDRQAGIIESGRWSIIGSKGPAVQYASNLFGVTEQTPVEASTGTLPGSLNGHMQPIKSSVYTFVSAEYVPIDTRAPGSTPTFNVFKVGHEKVTSAPIGQGLLALHIAVFDGEAPGGELKTLSNSTYVIDQPYNNTDDTGVREAAEDLEHWREAPGNDLIVMQTFGEETVSPNTAPWGSPNWVNDALLHRTETGLREWYGQPYVKVKDESESEEVLDRFWNPGYPTVAGQVGDLTGPAGHDLVANFGLNNPDIEVTRLTMVAANHALNPEANFVVGTATTENGTPQGRLVGTLTRNSEAGWTVRSASSAETFRPSRIWEMAYAEPTAWPMSESREDKAAMLAITKQMFGPHTAITNLREEYASDKKERLLDLIHLIAATSYEPSKEYSEATFVALRRQLMTELDDVYAVKEAIGEWKNIYGKESSDRVQVGKVSGVITQEVIANAAKEKAAEAEVNPEAIVAESLYTLSDIVGFPEVYEAIRLPEMFGMVAGGVALAEAASPEGPEQETEGPESSLIRAEADEIGARLAEHVEAANFGLEQLEEILVSDWGKLSAAAPEAQENWKIVKSLETSLEQSLTIDTERQLYEGLLPTAFEQWVLAPWYTATNPNGPQAPGKKYACLQYKGSFEDEETKHPFKDEPTGGVSTAIYRPFGVPGSVTSPAVPNNLPYTIRGLKSTSDRLKLKKVGYAENRIAITVEHDGSSPKASLMEPLFEPVLNGESVVNPKRLGINKTEFFANYGGGPADWSRAICAQE